MSRRSIGIITAATAGIACAALIGGPAFADTPTPTPSPSASHAPKTLAQIQAAGAKATSDRETKLTAAIAKVNADKYLTSGDKSTILARLNNDLAGMKSSASAIAADTTTTQAAADLKKVYDSYRVYAVALPQARDASAADRLTGTTIPKLTKEQSTLADLLSGADKAKSTSALQSDLSDLTAQLATASHDASRVSAAALAVTPSSYDSNHSALSSAKSSLASARTAVKKAESDAKSVREAIKTKK
ncbi:hypothetical protein [Leifsonia shinshuensis]|uniref:NlpC/P60 family protein n=1 Tax=Leifsonia shinshuensis TaxID=150026 RepID=A0A7G6YBC7_9MICO|nr:hypothetical protein [Leifsonia shinshuensis]QNE35792.1 hypothetical protein F1C12_12070 [Leifsonia shinshuensis]